MLVSEVDPEVCGRDAFGGVSFLFWGDFPGL